jgi:hypothetical protein
MSNRVCRKATITAALAGAAFLLGACGGNDSPPKPEESRFEAITDFNVGAELTAADRQELVSHPAVKAFLLEADSRAESAASVADTAPVRHETVLPHATQSALSGSERALLVAYLDAPNDVVLARFLAVLHLRDSLLARGNRAPTGQAFRHSILANYFLDRVIELSGRQSWTDALRARNLALMAQVMAKGDAATAEEDHAAHAKFLEAFNDKEDQRYAAADQLIDDYVAQPKNTYTSFLLTAVNAWNAGEADHADPTALYHFIEGAFFSRQTMVLAKEMEDRWKAQPATQVRFRMSRLLGGFSVVQRRWLAKLHGDRQAITTMDDEHRQWRLLHRSFHAFTLGLEFFDESENFAEGMAAYADGFTHCKEMPTARPCGIAPRYSHNSMAFVLGYVDFLLKAGQVSQARGMLSLRTSPAPVAKDWPQFTYGHSEWTWREDNLQQIADAYETGDVSKTPVHFFKKSRKWAEPTQTCQACHQVQATQWTPDQKLVNPPMPEELLTVGTWPALTTNWYGSSKLAD